MEPALRAFDASRDLRDKRFRSLCYAPFVQLSFSPTGDVSACCASRSHVLGNVRQQRLDDIWQGEPIRKFRESLKDYAFPSGCEVCAWSLDANESGLMIRSFDRFAIATEAPWPAQFEFALSNTCNLGCIMCSGELSSVIRAKQGLPPLPRAYDDLFFEDLARYLPHVQSLSFLGGEPFVQKECFRILEMLIEMGLHPTCHVTTNGTVYDDRVERVLAELPVDLAISIDGVTKETVESIRVNAGYDELMANVQRFNRYVQGQADRHAAQRRRWLVLNYCVMRQNWQELPDFFLFAEDLGARIWTTLVISPAHCSLFSLPRPELRAIVASLEARTPTLVERLEQNREHWLQFMRELQQRSEEDAAAVDAVNAAVSQTRASAANASTPSMWRAYAFMAQGKLEEALQEALQTPPTDPLYYGSLVLTATIEARRGGYEAAEAALRKALALAARRPEAYVARAWLRHRQGRTAEGLRDLETAQQLVDRLEGVEEMTADAVLASSALLLHSQGATEQALGQLHRHRELRPDETARHQALAQLKGYLGLEPDEIRALDGLEGSRARTRCA